MFSIKVGDIEGLKTQLDKEIERLERRLVKRLSYIGEQAVKEARLYGEYIDRTGNLRSSIGYVVLKDGQPIVLGSPKVYRKGDEGAQVGQDLLEQLRGQFPTGYVLLIVAGMNYASYVEDIYGRNVLLSAKLLAEDLIRKYSNNP